MAKVEPTKQKWVGAKGYNKVYLIQMKAEDFLVQLVRDIDHNLRNPDIFIEQEFGIDISLMPKTKRSERPIKAKKGKGLKGFLMQFVSSDKKSTKAKFTTVHFMGLKAPISLPF